MEMDDDMDGMHGQMDDMDGMDDYGEESGAMVSQLHKFKIRASPVSV